MIPQEPRLSPLSLSTAVTLAVRRWLFLAVAACSVAVLLFAASFLLPNTFRAVSLVMPPDRTSSSAFSMMGAAASSSLPSGALAALNLKSPGDLYVALMMSPSVEDAVIDRFNLAAVYRLNKRSLVRKRLEANTEVVADAKSGIISVSVTDRSPARAADLANGIVTAFETFSSQLAITDAARRRLFFERQVLDTKNSLTEAENKLKSTSSNTGVLEPEGNARAMIGYGAQLRAEVATKTVELQSLKVYLSDDNPQVQVAERELQTLRQQADALEAKNGSAYSASTESSGSLDYVRALRDVRADETLYELLLKNLEIAKLDEAREGNVIQVVSVATPPDTKNGPHRSFFLVGGFLLGLIAAILWVLSDALRRGTLLIQPEPA